MLTRHQIYFQDSRNMKAVASRTADLVVTSPPYPMIEMWDAMFVDQNAEIGDALNKNDGPTAFELMHKELDTVWQEVWRILKDSGIVCVNVGDAARTLDNRFRLYPNHSRIMNKLLSLGFEALPAILWRKQTNAPNKFMGSGMLPPGAYVTLEHEYILILRKGPKRKFNLEAEKKNRRESAFFWEERNAWFSDVWMDIKGTSQHLGMHTARLRSAAFPFEIPYRLISMFSVKKDIVVDPFLGVGTTMWAAMAAGRNCIGYEIEEGLRSEIDAVTDSLIGYMNDRINSRIQAHVNTVKQNRQPSGAFKYINSNYRFPVKTRQEVDILINPLSAIDKTGKDGFSVSYSTEPSLPL